MMKKTISILAFSLAGSALLAQNLNPTVEVTNTYDAAVGGRSHLHRRPPRILQIDLHPGVRLHVGDGRLVHPLRSA